MSSGWQPVVVPLVGSQSDTDPASGQPRLFDSENARFTRTNTIAPRPGFNARTQSVKVGSVPATSEVVAFPGHISTETGHTEAFVPSFLATLSRVGGDELLCGCTNRLLTWDSTAWYDRGVLASHTFRRVGGDTTPGGLLSSDYCLGIKGSNYDMVVHNTSASVAKAFFLGDAGQVIGSTTFTYTAFAYATIHNFNPASIYLTAIGEIKMDSYGTQPLGTSVTTTTLATDYGAGNVVAFWESGANANYIVYGSTTANQVKILKVTSALAVTSTTFALGAAVSKVCITASTNKVLVAGATAAGAITTKVYSTALVDQAVNVSYTGTGYITLGCTDTFGWVAVNALGVYRRSMTAATGITIGLKAGVNYWSHIYIADSRAYVGTLESTPGTSVLLISDVTDASDTWQTAARLANGTAASSGASYGVMTPTYEGFFGVQRFVTFDVDGGVNTQPGLYQFSRTAPKAVTYRDCLYLSGSCPSVYDGFLLAEQNFNRTPSLTTTLNLATGTLTAGSYTYQVTYRYINAAGQVERSPASLPVTGTTAGIDLSLTLTIKSLELTNKTGVLVEVWRTDINPGANAPLYLLATVANSLTADTVTYTDSAPTANLTSQEILYTVGNVLDQEPVSADGGFTVSGGRLWAFSDDRLWVSNSFVANQMPWFSTITGVDSSTELGPTIALEASGDKVFMFYGSGVTLTGGPGFNEIGQGGGYFTPQLVAHIPGPLSARGTCEVPGGVAFQSARSGSDLARLTLITQALQTTVLPFPDGVQTNPGVDEWELASNQERDELYVVHRGGICRVFNYRTYQWSLWTVGTLNPASATLYGGRVQLLVDGYVYAEQGDPLADHNLAGTAVAWTERLWTNWVSPSGPQTAWGRVREVVGVGEIQDSHAVSAVVQYDGLNVDVDTYTGTITGGSTSTWPNSAYRPTVQLSRQKCESLRLRLTLTMGTANDGTATISSLEFKVKPVDALSPKATGNSLTKV